MTLRDIEAQLMAPGAPFEVRDEDVLGERMAVFAQRPRSLAALVAGSLAHGGADYLVFADADGVQRLSFAAHARQVASVAVELRERYGVGPGDRVAIAAANCPEWIVAFWATVSLGAVAVGLNGWWTGAELRYGIEHSAPKLVVADARRAERLGEVAVPVVAIETDFAALADAHADAALPEATIAEDDPAVMLYTSGTSGRPKGVLHSHRNVVAICMLNFFHGARMAMLRPPAEGAAGPCTFVTSPLFHVSGLHCAAVTCLAAGVKSVWLRGRFDAGVALEIMAREQVTGWGYTATLLSRLVAHPDASRVDLSAVRHLGGGGSPIPPALQARAREVFPGARDTLGVGYGSTECSALATLNPASELVAHPTSCGRVMPTVQVEIRDAAGAAVDDGIVGDVYVRSPLVMLGYWDDPDATAAAIGPGRWLRTGDLGHMDGGRLYLSSRRSDLILRGGENVYPAEIELRLAQHPSVAEAAVVGVAHPELGEEVCAVVVPAAGAAIDEVALADWVASALAYFKVPAHWRVRAEPLPRNATGKLLRHVVRDDTDSMFVEES